MLFKTSRQSALCCQSEQSIAAATRGPLASLRTLAEKSVSQTISKNPMKSVTKQMNVFSVAILSGALALPAFGQDVDIQAGGTNVEVGSRGVDVDVDPSDDRTIARPPRVDADPGNTLNTQIASWALTDQQSIVELAQFGFQHSQTPAVKELATTIAREHQQLAQQLGRISQADGSVNAEANIQRRQELRANRELTEVAQEATTEARRDELRNSDGVRTPLENFGDRIENRARRLADRAERAAGATRDAIDRSTVSEEELSGYRLSQSPWLQIHREIRSELDQSSRAELEQYQGYQFDASFIGMMIAAHLQQEATLKVLSQHASGDLATTLQTSLEKMRSHREQAEQVMDAITPTR